MGFASYLEDNIERLNERIHLTKARLEKGQPNHDLRQEVLATFADAEVLLAKVTRELDLATSPEMDLAHEVSRLEAEVRSLRSDLAGEKRRREQAEERARRAEQAARRAEQQVRELRGEKRKLEKDFENLPFDTAVGAYLSPGRLEKHRR